MREHGNAESQVPQGAGPQGEAGKRSWPASRLNEKLKAIFLCLPEMQGVVYFGTNVPDFIWLLLAGAAIREPSAHTLMQANYTGKSYSMLCLAAPQLSAPPQQHRERENAEHYLVTDGRNPTAINPKAGAVGWGVGVFIQNLCLLPSPHRHISAFLAALDLVTKRRLCVGL